MMTGFPSVDLVLCVLAGVFAGACLPRGAWWLFSLFCAAAAAYVLFSGGNEGNFGSLLGEVVRFYAAGLIIIAWVASLLTFLFKNLKSSDQ